LVLGSGLNTEIAMRNAIDSYVNPDLKSSVSRKEIARVLDYLSIARAKRHKIKQQIV